MDETEVSIRAFLKEPRRNSRLLSIDEVRRESLPAWNVRGSDRYYYDPYWDCIEFGDALLDVPGTYPWRLVNGAAVPTDGWEHEEGCACGCCRRGVCSRRAT